MKLDFLTVAIVTRNRHKLLQKCFLSLQKQKKELFDEILIIDNGSTDKTKEIVTSFKNSLPIRYIYEPHIGIAKARNRALKEAKGKLLAFIDDDCQAAPTWVEEMVKAHKRYPNAAAIQGKALFSPHESIFAKSFSFNYKFWVWRSSLKGNRTTIFDTCNVVINREKIQALKIRFDTSFTRASDVDFGKQLVAKKEEIIYAPKAKVNVYVRDNIIDMFLQRYKMGIGNKQLENKWENENVVSRKESLEYKKRLEIFIHSMSFIERIKFRIFFYMYRPFFYLGKLRVKTKNKFLAKEQNSRSLMSKANYIIDKEITVAIVTRNRKDAISRCLESLSIQTVLPQKVIIIDNASTDGTKTTIFSKIYPFTIQYIYEKNIGVAYARNRALREAKGKLLAFIDDDCQATSTWIAEMIKAHKKYPNAVAIQGKCIVYPPRGVISNIMQYMYDRWIHQYLFGKKIFVLDTANVSLKLNKIVKKRIMFSTEFLYACDDIDFALKLWTNKLPVYYTSTPIVYSDRPMSKLSLISQRIEKGKARALLDSKWTVQVNDKKIRIQNMSYPLSLEEQKEHRDKLSHIKLYIPQNLLLQIKTKVILFMWKWIFRTSYLHEKKKYKGDILSQSSAYLAQGKASLSVGIVTRNRAKKLNNLLLSMLNQSIQPNEILIIDNASSDKTQSLITAFKNKLPIRYIYEPHIGIANARNRALKEAKGKLLAFIDDDCQATPTWVEEMVKAHKRYPNAAAIQGKNVYRPENTVKADISTIKYTYWLHVNMNKKNRLRVLDTKNILLNLDKIKKLHILFDTLFTRGSDVDFGKQLIAKKQEIIYEENIIAFHYERDKLWDYLKKIYLTGKSRAYMDYKWPEVPRHSNKLNSEISKTIEILNNKYSFFKKIKFDLLYKLSKWIFNKGYTENEYYQDILKIKLPSKKKGNISVCVVTKDRQDYLYRCLFHLIKQSVYPEEILIIDSSVNKSKTQDIVKIFQNLLPIRYIHEKAQGIAHGRNTAIKNACGDIIGFIDDDCGAGSTWIEEMIKAHKKYPDVIAIQGQVFFIPFTGLMGKCYKDDYHAWVKNNLQKNGNFFSLDFENSSFKRIPLLNLGIRCDVTYKNHYYCDDVDFGYQILFAKQVIKYYPYAYVLAKRKTNIYAICKERWLKGRSRAMLELKWKFIRTKNSLFILDRKVNFIQSNFTINNNPYHIDTANYLNAITEYLYPYFAKLFRGFYLTGYIFQRMLFEYDYKRLSKSLIPQNYKISKKLTVSVMIITKDRETLQRSLLSLINQTVLPSEVIIIDSSGKPIKDVVEHFKKELPLVYSYQPKLGFGIARNTAMKKASSDIVATLDDDAKADRQWIENIIKAHNMFPSYIAIQGRIISMPKASFIARVEQLHMERWFLRRLDKDNSIRLISTKNISFKRKEYIENNLAFNKKPLYGRYGSEDVDMSYQILDKKLNILFEPSIVVYHWERSTLIAYLKQQNRKGHANGLIIHDWKEMVEKMKNYFPLPKYLEPILTIATNPLTHNKFWLYPLLYIIFYLADIQYSKGKKRITKELKKLEKKEIESVNVIIIYKQNIIKNLEDQLFSLMHQSKQPKRVILLTKEPLHREVLDIYKNIFPILVFTLTDQKKVDLLIERELKGEILVFLDEFSLPNYFWIENIKKAHIKYSDEYIQGITKLSKKNNMLNIIMQFNRQTFIRNTMSGQRAHYWKWIEGKSDKDYYVSIFDPYIISAKINNNTINNISSNLTLMFNNSINNLWNYPEKKILLCPNIYITKFNSINVSIFMKQAFLQGKIYLGSKNQFTYKGSLNLFKKTMAFSYFCFKNRAIVRLPLMITYFLLYQCIFLYSYKGAQKKLLMLPR